MYFARKLVYLIVHASNKLAVNKKKMYFRVFQNMEETSANTSSNAKNTDQTQPGKYGY